MEVKPCPFCSKNNINVVEGGNYRWRVAYCTDCGAQAGEVRVLTNGQGSKEELEEDARHRAFGEWNKRV